MKTKTMENQGKFLISIKTFMIFSFLTIGMNAIGAQGLPFYDKLELGLKICKTIGGMIAMASMIAAFYFMNEGNRDVVKKCAWFVGAGILTANIEWLADKVGFLSGALI